MASYPGNRHSPGTVIAIDGPAGAGKSTVARQLAKRLKFFYLDTGAMYRALTLKALRRKIDLQDEEALAKLAAATAIDIHSDKHGELAVILDGKDVSGEIRSQMVTENTFYIARTPKVRAVMVARQREIGAKQNVVIDGRDIGTVVFPGAQKKFYLDADFKERASRRIKELREEGKIVDEAALAAQLSERDQKDMTRSVGPLKKADDAIVIDSTHLSVEEVVNKMLEYIR